VLLSYYQVISIQLFINHTTLIIIRIIIWDLLLLIGLSVILMGLLEVALVLLSVVASLGIARLGIRIALQLILVLPLHSMLN